MSDQHRDRPLERVHDSASEPAGSEWLPWLTDHIEGQVVFSDTKAGLLLTADSILLAAHVSVATSEHLGLSSFTRPTQALTGLSFLALVVALVFALLAIIPNWRNLFGKAVNESITNFSWIASLPVKSFAEHASNTTRSDLEASITRTLHGKATWARRKFRLLFGAVAATELGAALAVIAVVVEVVHE